MTAAAGIAEAAHKVLAKSGASIDAPNILPAHSVVGAGTCVGELDVGGVAVHLDTSKYLAIADLR